MISFSQVNFTLAQQSINSFWHKFFFNYQDALLHAIKEEYVEAVELLLQWEEEHHVSGEPYVRTQLYDFF